MASNLVLEFLISYLPLFVSVYLLQQLFYDKD